MTEEEAKAPQWAEREGWQWSAIMQRARRSLPFDRLVILVHANGAADFIYRDGDVDYCTYGSAEVAVEAADNLFRFIEDLAGESVNILVSERNSLEFEGIRGQKS